MPDPAFSALLEQDSQSRQGLWRVERMALVPVPRDLWGSFYSGDCYLLYHRNQVYFWIGSQCSVDEQTVAAIKAVELDDMFGGLPVQHREAQGYESAKFKAVFPEGLIILLGGMESGLKKAAAKEEEAKMFHVKGGRRPVLTQVAMSWSSMNHGDTFVLDSGKRIFVWAGTESSPQEKFAAASLASRLRDHVGEEVVHVTDGGEEEDCDEEWTEHLPLEGRGQVRPREEHADEKTSKNVQKEISLHRVSDMTGSLQTVEVKVGQLEAGDLDGSDAFIVCAGSLGVWVWLGRHSSLEERRAALGAGQSFLKGRGLPEYTALTRVAQGGEPEEFKSLFNNW